MPRWVVEVMRPLAVLRAEAGLSRSEAAVALNIGVTTLQRYEMAENDVPLGVAERMAVVYHRPFEDVRRAANETRLKLQDWIRPKPKKDAGAV